METVKDLKATLQKDYYGKAKIIEDDEKIYLQSYNTRVLYLDKKTNKIVKLWFGYSRTTQNHINDFLMAYGFNKLNKKEWLNMQNDKEKKTLYQIIGTNGFISFKAGALYDDSEQAWRIADELNKKSNGFRYFEIMEV